jgi:hypothetical protein
MSPNIEKLIARNTTHGLSKKNIRLYRIWKGMKSRCYIKTASGFKNYGARGIRVCEDWFDYSLFYEWAMKNGYEESLTLERIDVNGNYEPSNCKWITMEQQKSNTRNVFHIEIRGEILNLSQISNKYGINYGTLFSRYKNGERGERLIRKVDERLKRHV